MVCIHGDMSKHVFKTKFKRSPTKGEINYMDYACKALIDKYEIILVEDKLIVLWYVDCLVYSVIASWIEINNIKGMRDGNKTNSKVFETSKQVADIDTLIKDTRAYISKCDAESQRLQYHGRLTWKTRCNPARMKHDCEVISIY